MARARAIPTTIGKTRYRSKFESQVAANLPEGTQYEKRRLPYEIAAVYMPDFELPGGVLLEVKGRFTPIDRRKMIEVKRTHPGLDIRFVFMNAKQRLNPKLKRSLTYGQWAEANGFKWCQGPEIPSEWLV